MTKYYRDVYGCTASITETRNGAKLTVRIPTGKIVKRGNYNTFRGARIAMGELSECWNESGQSQ